MSNALMKSGSSSSGVVPGVASAVIPGVGQLLNGESDKAIGVFAIWVVTGASFLGGLPLIGGVAGLVCLGTHIYAAADGWLTGRKK